MGNSVLTAQDRMSKTFLECCQNIVNMGLEATDVFGKQVTQAMVITMADFNANNAKMAQSLNDTLENATNSFNENNFKIVTEVLRRSELKADQVISMLNARGGEFADIARNFQTSLQQISQEWRRTVTMLGLAVVLPLILIAAATFMPETDKQDLSHFLKFFLSDKTYSKIDIMTFVAYASGMIWFGRVFVDVTEMWNIAARHQELLTSKVQILEQISVLKEKTAQEEHEKLLGDMKELQAAMTEQQGQWEKKWEDQERIRNCLEKNIVTGMGNLSNGIVRNRFHGDMVLAMTSNCKHAVWNIDGNTSYQDNKRKERECKFDMNLHKKLFHPSS